MRKLICRCVLYVLSIANMEDFLRTTSLTSKGISMSNTIQKNFFEKYNGKTNQQIFEILLQKYNSEMTTKNQIKTPDENIIKASLVISDMIGKNLKYYNEGHFIKNVLRNVPKSFFQITQKFLTS